MVVVMIRGQNKLKSLTLAIKFGLTLYAVQGSLGTGIICYFIGAAHGKKKAAQSKDKQTVSQ